MQREADRTPLVKLCMRITGLLAQAIAVDVGLVSVIRALYTHILDCCAQLRGWSASNPINRKPKISWSPSGLDFTAEILVATGKLLQRLSKPDPIPRSDMIQYRNFL